VTARVVTLFVHEMDTADTVAIDFGSPTNFVAWTSITWIDPRSSAFDINNAIGVDIPFITPDGSTIPTTRVLSGGVLGPPGSNNNLRQTAFEGFGRSVTFRLRAFPSPNGELACVANGVAITNP
jgi:hypothetical protein